MLKFHQFNKLKESFNGFNNAIDTNGDWTDYLVYADFLEDNGQEILANLIRMLHEKNFSKNKKSEK